MKSPAAGGEFHEKKQILMLLLCLLHLQPSEPDPAARMSYGSIHGSFGRNPFGGPTKQGYWPVGKESALYYFM